MKNNENEKKFVEGVLNLAKETGEEFVLRTKSTAVYNVKGDGPLKDVVNFIGKQAEILAKDVSKLLSK